MVLVISYVVHAIDSTISSKFDDNSRGVNLWTVDRETEYWGKVGSGGGGGGVGGRAVVGHHSLTMLQSHFKIAYFVLISTTSVV